MSTISSTTAPAVPTAASSFLRTRVGKRLLLWLGSSNNVYSDEDKSVLVGKFTIATGSISATLPISRTLTIQLQEDGVVSSTLVFAITSESAASDDEKSHHLDLIGGSGDYKSKRGHGSLTMSATNTPDALDVLTFVR
jgi:hypothetical protein